VSCPFALGDEFGVASDVGAVGEPRTSRAYRHECLGKPSFVGAGEQRPVVVADPSGPRSPIGGNRGLSMTVGAGHGQSVKHCVE
jgi:hypothetical protein